MDEHRLATQILAMIGVSCRLGRAVELELGPQLDALALAYEAAEAKAAREAARARAAAAKAETEACEAAWREDLRQRLAPMHQELWQGIHTLAGMLGAKGTPTRLRRMCDEALRDSVHDPCHGTASLSSTFPALTQVTHECSGAELKEVASYVRSMLCRAGIAPARLMHAACHLRIL